MEHKTIRIGYIISLALIGLLLIGAICLSIFVDNITCKIIGTLVSSISASAEVSLAFSISISINIEKKVCSIAETRVLDIVNKYKVDFESNVTNNNLTITNYHMTNYYKDDPKS